MASSLEDTLRRCVEDLELKDRSVRGAPSSFRSNGAYSRVKHLEPKAAEEKKSPQHQGAIGKQLQGGISKQQHRRSSKGNVKILSADESNFKALVFEHTCMLSHPVPNGGGVIMEPTSPLSLQSNSSGSTWESLSQAAAAAAGGVSMSQPASPHTPASPQSKMGFFSQPTSPLSHSASPTPLWLSDSDEARSNALYGSSCTVQAYNPLPDVHANLNFSPPYPHHATSNESNGVPPVPQCASAPCLLTADNHQAGWFQQGTPFLHPWRTQ